MPRRHVVPVDERSFQRRMEDCSEAFAPAIVASLATIRRSVPQGGAPSSPAAEFFDAKARVKSSTPLSRNREYADQDR